MEDIFWLKNPMPEIQSIQSTMSFLRQRSNVMSFHLDKIQEGRYIMYKHSLPPCIYPKSVISLHISFLLLVSHMDGQVSWDRWCEKTLNEVLAMKFTLLEGDEEIARRVVLIGRQWRETGESMHVCYVLKLDWYTTVPYQKQDSYELSWRRSKDWSACLLFPLSTLHASVLDTKHKTLQTDSRKNPTKSWYKM